MTVSSMPVRVRYAPSPTRFLHIGGVRTALFNWLFARHNGGEFLIRIEDTDEKRFVAGAADDALASLRWVGIDWDEGPDIGGPHGSYVQSERHAAGIYRPFVEQLLTSLRAYKSFVTEAEIDMMRAEARASGIASFRFRGPERDWTAEQVYAAEARGLPCTVRLKVPLDGTTEFHDLIRGGERISVDNATLYDVVLVKSSGMPTYNLAHLVDDHLMEITHVIRGEEWVATTPYHVCCMPRSAGSLQCLLMGPTYYARMAAVSSPSARIMSQPIAFGNGDTSLLPCSIISRSKAGATTIKPRSCRRNKSSHAFRLIVSMRHLRAGIQKNSKI